MGYPVSGAAIITGGSGGIGAATARELAACGAHVVIADLREDAAARLAEDIRGDGGEATSAHLDVTDPDSWTALLAGLAGLPPIRTLVNNAGIAAWGADVESETLEGWTRMIAINQTGVWLGMRAIIGPMREAGGGSIINLASVFATTGGYGEEVAYHASKGAVRLMSKNAAVRWAEEGVRVNSIHPGFIRTPMALDDLDEAHESKILAETPMRRLGDPEEVATVIAFLASDAASYMTGSEVYVDGGYTAH